MHDTLKNHASSDVHSQFHIGGCASFYKVTRASTANAARILAMCALVEEANFVVPAEDLK